MKTSKTSKTSNARRSAKNAAPVTADAAADARRSYLRSIDPACVPAALRFYFDRAVDAVSRRGARFDYFVNVNMPASVSTDEMLTLAASFLARAGFASMFPGVSPVSMNAIHALAGFYYVNRKHHTPEQNPSTTDEYDTAASIAEMLIANVDARNGRNARRDFAGSYGKSSLDVHPIRNIAAAVRALRDAPPPVNAADATLDAAASL